jgi:hypothetical protein
LSADALPERANQKCLLAMSRAARCCNTGSGACPSSSPVDHTDKAGQSMFNHTPLSLMAKRLIRERLDALDRRIFRAIDLDAIASGWRVHRCRPFGRTYRDPRWDDVSACSDCRGSGTVEAHACDTCAGTGTVRVGRRERCRL